MKSRNTRLLLAALLVVIALFAAACGGEASENTETGTTEASTDTDPPDETVPPATDGDGTATTEGGDPPSTDAATYDDPRGGIFTDFQAGIDRSHPFNGLDSFCQPHDEAADRQDTDRGITADTVEIHHVRQELENLVDIGFALDVGDPDEMFQFLVREINENCGGIRGRQLVLTESSFNPLDSDVESARLATCIEATEDNAAVIVMNSSGFGGTAALCMAEDADTAFISTTGFPSDFYPRGEGRLITMQPSDDVNLRDLVLKAEADGMLEGKIIGIAHADAVGNPEAIDAGLVAPLEELGYEVAVRSTIGCGGGTSCSEGTQSSVTDMLDAGVDAMFVPLNVLSLPAYITEMVAQGFQPGEVQFFNSNFNSQAGDLVSSKVSAFGGEEVANMYNDAYLVDGAATGNFQLEGAVVPPLNGLCIETYAKQGGPEYDYFALDGNTPQGMLATVCSQVRIMARAIYDAGDNPTRADVFTALNNLGPVDTNNNLVATLTPGKYTAFDTLQSMTWSFPCADGFAAFDDNGTCIIPNADWGLSADQ